MPSLNSKLATSIVTNRTALSLATTSATQVVSNAGGSNKVFLMQSVTIANTDASNAVTVTLALYKDATNSGTAYELVSNFSVPAGSSLVALEKAQGVTVLQNQSLYVTAGTSSKLKVFASWEEVYTPTPVTIPGQVTGLTATSGVDQIALSWTAPTDDGNGALSYIVESSTNGGASFATEKTVSGTSTTVTGYSSGTSLIFRVAAINSAGMGAYSTATDSVEYRMKLYWTVTTNDSNAYFIGSGNNTANVDANLGKLSLYEYRGFRGVLTSQVAGTLTVTGSAYGELMSGSVDFGQTQMNFNKFETKSVSVVITAGQQITVGLFGRKTYLYDVSSIGVSFELS